MTSDGTDNHRIARLPIWAQEHIGYLQRRLEATRADLKTVMGKSRTAVFFIRDPDNMTEFHPLPGRSLRIDINPEFFIDFTQRAEDEGVAVTIYGSSPIYIEPGGANTFRILQRPR